MPTTTYQHEATIKFASTVQIEELVTPDDDIIQKYTDWEAAGGLNELYLMWWASGDNTFYLGFDEDGAFGSTDGDLETLVTGEYWFITHRITLNDLTETLC
jgi:hypothetical protein